MSSQSPSAIHDPPVTLVFLPGVGGRLPINDEFISAVLHHRLATDAVQIDWTHQRQIGDIMREADRNRLFAASIRDELLAIRRKHPRTRIILAAHSAGCGPAVWALEQSDAALVDDLLLMAPALSKDYDLSPALSRVKGRAWAFWSPLDVTVLGAGTRSMGTIDRKFESAAGLTGFSCTDPRLTQVRIDYADLRTTTAFAHVTPLTDGYVRDEIGPRLRSP